MPQLEQIEQLMKEFEGKASTTEEQLFLANLKAANTYMSALYGTDEYGRIPYVSEEDKYYLMSLHQGIGERSEALLSN